MRSTIEWFIQITMIFIGLPAAGIAWYELTEGEVLHAAAAAAVAWLCWRRLSGRTLTDAIHDALDRRRQRAQP